MQPRAQLGSSRASVTAIAAFLVIACDSGHADYALDLTVRLRIVDTSGAPVPGAAVSLTEYGKPVNASPPLCVSNSAGLCEGKRFYAFGRSYFRWRGAKKESGLALRVSASGHDNLAIRLSDLTREEVAGRRAIERDVVLARSE